MFLVVLFLAAVPELTAQARIARGYLTAQRSIYKVTGNSSPICVGLYQVDADGNLLAFSSYYLPGFKTIQVTPVSFAGRPSLPIFAIYQPIAGTPGTVACNVVPSAVTILSDSSREPKIWLTLGVNNLATNLIVQAIATASTQTNDCTLNVSGGIDNSVNQVCSNNLEIGNNNVSLSFGLEEVSFQATQSAALVALTTNCQSPTTYIGTAFVVTCALPVGGGTFSDQSIH
jgi:hypothetical protein